MKKLNQAILDLVLDDTYTHIGGILQCMNIKSTNSIPTAGVNYDKKRKKFNLYFNPDFFDKITAKQRKGVCVHEVDHILHKHVFWDIKKEDMRTWNVAMDLVINQGNDNLPEGAMLIKNFRDKNGKLFEANKPTEHYYNLLVEQGTEMKVPNQNQKGDGNQEQSESGSGGDQQDQNQDGEWKDFQDWMKQNEGEQVTLDAHDWAESMGEDEKEALEAMKDLLRAARKRVESYGKNSGALKDMLEELDVQLGRINFKEVLKNAIKKSIPSNDFSRTYCRPNRRLGYKAAGKRTNMLPRVDFLVDTSGSIDMETLNMFTEITQGFLGMVSRANLHLFHTETYKTIKVKRGYKLEPSDVQCGGTDLTDSFEKLMKQGTDIVIVLTDGYFGEPNVDLKKLPKTVFLIDQRGDHNHPLSTLCKTYKYEALNG